ncbi:MAG: phosphonate transport system permease protein, partial [Gammaproteobacteria bacterium]
MSFFPRPKQASSAQKLKNVSLFFVLLALVFLFFADSEIVTSSPWFELGKIGFGAITPDFFSTENLFTSIINTLAFALLGTFVANVCGFILALFFKWRFVRTFCAFIRAIHELFWALLFLQVFGLSTLTGVLAIAIPFTGIFAKVYAEILEESDQTAWQVTSSRSDWLSRFLYTRLPQAFVHFKSYSLYRLECGIRSSAILGFIGLPTLGFHLETAFSQGLYSQAAALLYIFFFIIATLRFWLQIKLLPLYIIGALLWLPDSDPVSWHLLSRFITEDIVPSPLRGAIVWDLQQLQV